MGQSEDRRTDIPHASRWLPFLLEQPWRYYVGFAIGRAAGLIVLPITARVLGPDGLGQFEVALAVMMAATILLDAGLGASIVRYWEDERFDRADVLGSAISLQLAVAAGASIVVAPLALTLELSNADQLLLAGVIVTFVFVEGFAVIGAAILRSSRRDRTFLTLSATRLLVAGTLGSIGALTLGIPGALLGVALGGIGFALLPAAVVIRGGTFGTPLVRRQLARYGFPLIATTAATWCLALADRVLLQPFVTSAELGEYSANYRLGSLVLTFIAAPLALAWLPVAQRTPPEERRTVARRWATGFTMVALSAVVGLTASAFVVVPGIFGSDFQSDAWVVLLVGIAGWLGGLYHFLVTPLVVRDSTTGVALCAIGTIAVALCTTPLLIVALDVRGAALATAVSYGGLCGLAWLVSRKHWLVDAQLRAGTAGA